MEILIYCIRLRKLTPTLITLDFGCAFILGLRDNSKTIFAKAGQFNQVTAYIILDSGQLTVFTTHISSAKPS